MHIIFFDFKYKSSLRCFHISGLRRARARQTSDVERLTLQNRSMLQGVVGLLPVACSRSQSNFAAKSCSAEIQDVKQIVVHEQFHSVAEVEVVVSVAVVFTLAEAGADEVEGEWDGSDSEPYAHAKVDNPSLDEEAFNAAVKPVEEPLLGGVGAMMEDVAASVRGLLVEVLFAVPRAPLHLGHAKALAVSETHVLRVTLLVVGQSAS